MEPSDTGIPNKLLLDKVDLLKDFVTATEN